MHDPALKVQLFRFVDTLPYLKQPRGGQPAPARVPHRGDATNCRGGRGGARGSSRNAGCSGKAAGVAGAAERRADGPEVHRRVERRRGGRGGPRDAEPAARVHHRPARRGDHHRGRGRPRPEAVPRPARRADARGERLARGADDRPRRPRADPARQRVGEALGAVQPVRPDRPGRHSRAVCKRLRPILSLAKQTGAFVNFDMEQYSFKDTTLRIFRDILTEPEFRDWPHVGIAIQAYLKDTEARPARSCSTGRRTTASTPVWVRLVKGAYWDYETVIAAQNDWPVPVFTKKWQSRRELREADRVPAGERRLAGARRSARTTSAASRTRWPWPSN